MSEWPKGWSEGEIKSIAHEVVVGFVGTTTPFYRESGIPYLTGKNIKNGSIDLGKIDFVSEEFDLEEGKSSLSPGDVVVVRIGRSGDAAVVPESLPKANCGGLIVIKRPLAVSPKFLSYYLNSPLGISSSRAEARGATRQTLNTKNIAEKVVPVPPREEQTRIFRKTGRTVGPGRYPESPN